MIVNIERGNPKVEVNREAENLGPVRPSVVAGNASQGLDRLSHVKNIVQGLRAIIGRRRSTDRDLETVNVVDLAREVVVDLDPVPRQGNGHDRVPGERGSLVLLLEVEEEVVPIQLDEVNLVAGTKEEHDHDQEAETDHDHDHDHDRKDENVRGLTFPGVREGLDLDLGIIENHDQDQGSRIIGTVRNRRIIGTGIEP